MKKILLLLCLLAFNLNIQAQWTNDSTLNTTVRDTAGATTPLMATTTNGSTYISWFEYGVGGNFELRMQLLDSNGYKLWAPEGIIVSNYPQNTALFRYDLKADNDGNAVVAFQDERTGVLNAVAYKVTAAGTLAWGAAGISLIDSAAQDGIAPVIGITTNNDVVIAWNSNTSTSKWISVQRFSPSGTPRWNNIYQVRDTVGSLKYSRPKLLPSGYDNILMLFVEENGSFPGVTSTLYSQKIDAAGSNSWVSPVKVSTKTIPYFVFPEPVSDLTGGMYVAFNSSNPVNTALIDVYVQHVDSTGTLWSTTGTEAANSTSTNKLAQSSCFVEASSEFWVLLRVQDGGQSLSGVSVQKFDASGNVLLGPNALDIVAMSSSNYIPNTINDAFDGIIFSSSYGGFSAVHVFAMKLDYSGTLLWAAFPVSLSAVNSNKDDLASGKFVGNNLVFVWQDDRGGASGVFAQNITGDGNTGIVTGIKNNILKNRISLFPNPSSAPTLKLNEGNNSLTLFDACGQKLFVAEIHSLTFSFSEFENISPGIYFVRVENDQMIETIQWLKE